MRMYIYLKDMKQTTLTLDHSRRIAISADVTKWNGRSCQMYLIGISFTIRIYLTYFSSCCQTWEGGREGGRGGEGRGGREGGREGGMTVIGMFNSNPMMPQYLNSNLT